MSALHSHWTSRRWPPCQPCTPTGHRDHPSLCCNIEPLEAPSLYQHPSLQHSSVEELENFFSLWSSHLPLVSTPGHPSVLFSRISAPIQQQLVVKVEHKLLTSYLILFLITSLLNSSSLSNSNTFKFVLQ